MLSVQLFLLITEIEKRMNSKILTLANNKKYNLPIKWDGNNFLDALTELLNDYNNDFFGRTNSDINFIIEGILSALKYFFNGLPSKAFKIFSTMFNTFYDKHFIMVYIKDNISDSLPNLYRIRKVNKITDYERKDIFHVPYNLRENIDDCRYSIHGFPSLYLSTSLKLSYLETKANRQRNLYIASLFKQTKTHFDSSIKVVELGIKPQDFQLIDTNSSVFERKTRCKNLNLDLINKQNYQYEYFYWYPLIAACSFCKSHGRKSFHPEYIIPQLLMETIRTIKKDDEVIGIRYFSCSNLFNFNLTNDINYVFPTSGKSFSEEFNYCRNLSKIFELTKPIILDPCISLSSQQEMLNKITDLKKIFE